MAFHIHRLGVSTTSLRAAGLSRDLARSVREGRLPLAPPDAAWLYQILTLDDGQLTRELTVDERTEWDFYRVSARHPVEVWRNAASAWRPHLSLREVCDLTGSDRTDIRNIVSGKTRSPVLMWSPAQRIAHAMDLKEGANAFLANLPSHPR